MPFPNFHQLFQLRDMTLNDSTLYTDESEGKKDPSDELVAKLESEIIEIYSIYDNEVSANVQKNAEQDTDQESP